MSKSRKRRKSSVNEAYLIVIAICALSFVVMIKQIFISISTSIANLSNIQQLALVIFTTTAIALIIYLNTKHINFFNKNRHKLLSSVDYMSLSTYEFEKFCAEVLNRVGYKVKVTKPTQDGGKDLVGTDPHNIKIYGECKQWTSTHIGRPHLQKMKGAMVDAKVSQGIFITTSRFSKQALDYAKRNNIKCVNRSELNKLINKADKNFYKSSN